MNNEQAVANALAGTGLIIGLISLAGIVFGIIVWWRIFSKAGYNGAMSLLLFVPIANIIVICMLAFSEWPILKELNALRQQNARGPFGQFPPNQGFPQNVPNPPFAQNGPNAQFPSGPNYQQGSQYPQNPQYSQQPQYPQQPQNPQYR